VQLFAGGQVKLIEHTIYLGRTLRKGLSLLSHRRPFVLKSALASCFLLFASVAPLCAQSDGLGAGGNWREYDSEDKMTAARRVKFELVADNTLLDTRTFHPKVELLCENGEYKTSSFLPGVRLAPPNRPGFWGQPQMEVMVRADNGHSNHGWNWNGNFLAMDKGTARELIGAEVFKIEFLGYSGPLIAEFSPGGLDRARVSKACGLTPKKPDR
jgi:hypothetical protein